MPPVYITVPPIVTLIIRRLIVREGGFVDHPADPGGATKWGITLWTLQQWRGKKVTKDDVRNLEEKEAIQIYYQWYWRPLALHHIVGNDYWIKEFIFDWAVNAGLKNPVRNIQKLIGVKRDGAIGPITAHKLSLWCVEKGNKYPGLLCDHRVRWYIRLVETKHTHIVFLEGWFNRANSMRYETIPYTNHNVTVT